jgi:hypothetical protein
MAIRIGTDMAHLAHKQDAELSNFCKDLENDKQNARLQMEDWQDQAERLEGKIETENEILVDLRQQRQRTGDDLFDIDIRQQTTDNRRTE